MKLSDEQIQNKLAVVKGWEYKDNSIQKKYEFKDFEDAMKFVNEIAEVAKRQDHHPDIEISYNKVNLRLTTHSSSGVTEKDFKLAGEIDSQ